MHDTFIVGIPLIAIIAGILFNRSDANRLEARIDSMKDEMHREFREFYPTLGQHDIRIDNLEKR